MTEREAIQFLNRYGNLSIPCCRYGRSTYEVSPIAYQAAVIIADNTGEPLTEDLLEDMMSLAVNDHDDIAYLLDNYGQDVTA